MQPKVNPFIINPNRSTNRPSNNTKSKPRETTYNSDNTRKGVFGSSKSSEFLQIFIAVGPIPDYNMVESILNMLPDYGFRPMYDNANHRYNYVEFSPDQELPFFIFKGTVIVEDAVWPKYDITLNGEPLYVEPCDIDNIQEHVEFNRNVKIHQKLLDFAFLKSRGFHLLNDCDEQPIDFMRVARFMLFLAAIKCYRYGYFDDNFDRNLSITHIRFTGNDLHSTNCFFTLKSLFRKLEYISFYDNPLKVNEYSHYKFVEYGIQPYFTEDFDLSSFYEKNANKVTAPKLISNEPSEKKVLRFKVHVPEIKENVVISNYMQIPCYEFAKNFISADSDNIYLFYDVEHCKISYTVDTCGKNSPLSIFSKYSSTHDNQNIFEGKDAVDLITNFYAEFPVREYYDYKCSQLTNNNMIAFVLYGIFQHKNGYYFGVNRVMTLIPNKSELGYCILNDSLFLHIQYE